MSNAPKELKECLACQITRNPKPRLTWNGCVCDRCMYIHRTMRVYRRKRARAVRSTTPPAPRPMSALPTLSRTLIPTATDEMVERIIGMAQSPVVVMALEHGSQICGLLEDLMKLAAVDWDDRIIFLRIWGDENPTLMDTFSILEYPTLFIFSRGKKIAQQGGVPSARVLTELLDGALTR